MMCRADVSASLTPTVEKHTQSVDPEARERGSLVTWGGVQTMGFS